MSTLTDYLQQIKQLLPRGPLWSGLAEDKTFQAYLEGEVEEKLRIHNRAFNLINETDPRTAYELLPEWEQFAGLPDPCLGELGTLEQRQQNLHTKLTTIGGQSRQYYIDLAATLGYTITITEFDQFSVNDTVDDSVNGADWEFAWQVNAPDETVTYLTASSDVDTALADWGNERLECAISRLKPAHTTVLFAYGG